MKSMIAMTILYLPYAFTFSGYALAIIIIIISSFITFIGYLKLI